MHGRQGIANDGVGALTRVHYGRNDQNAFWSDGCFCMTFGDGDNGATNLSPSSLVCNGNTSLVGIGRTAAGKIWYRALTVYMTSGTNYAQARAATLSAATDLYGNGSSQYNAVAAAWSAVSVN